MTETFLLIESNSVKENSFMALKHIAFGCAAVMAAAFLAFVLRRLL